MLFQSFQTKAKKKLTKYSFGTESNEQKIFTDEMYSSFSYIDIV